MHAGGDVGTAAGPAVKTGGTDHEFVVGDPACVAHQIGQGQRELLVVNVFDLTAVGIRGCAHGGEGRAGEGEKFAVTEHAADPDSSVDIFADAGSDAADVPCAAKSLLKDGDVNGRFAHDDVPDSCGHVEVAASLAWVDPARQGGNLRCYVRGGPGGGLVEGGGLGLDS